jgi:hypothetical protein
MRVVLVVVVVVAIFASPLGAWLACTPAASPSGAASTTTVDVPRAGPSSGTTVTTTATATAGTAAAGSGIGESEVPAEGCEGPCRGTGVPELGLALQQRAALTRRCYNQALASDPKLTGHVTLVMRIGSHGDVCSAVVAANDMSTPTVAACAQKLFAASAAFPAPRGGCIDATIPLVFIPQGVDAGP